MGRFVGLLRGINVGGHRRLPMAELRVVAADIGLDRVSTYLASGNLLFASDRGEAGLEPLLEEALAQRFGFPVDAIVRSAERWRGYARSNPFPEESAREPHLVMIALGKQPASDEDIASLRMRAGPNERVERGEDAIWDLVRRRGGAIEARQRAFARRLDDPQLAHCFGSGGDAGR